MPHCDVMQQALQPAAADAGGRQWALLRLLLLLWTRTEANSTAIVVRALHELCPCCCSVALRGRCSLGSILGVHVVTAVRMCMLNWTCMGWVRMVAAQVTVWVC